MEDDQTFDLQPRYVEDGSTIDLFLMDDDDDDTSYDDESEKNLSMICTIPQMIPYMQYCVSGTQDFGVRRNLAGFILVELEA